MNLICMNLRNPIATQLVYSCYYKKYDFTPIYIVYASLDNHDGNIERGYFLHVIKQISFPMLDIVLYVPNDCSEDKIIHDN